MINSNPSPPHPYQPPKIGEPQQSAQIARRRIGLALGLMLTPIATFIAFFITCSWNFYWDVQRLGPNVPRPFISEWWLPPLVAFLVFLPISVCALFVFWRQQRQQPTSHHA